MNFQDKAWMRYAGKPLLKHVIDHIEPDVDHILISRNAPNPQETGLAHLLIRDEMPDYQGPLSGIASCIRHITTDKVLVLPCDVPLLPSDLVPRLIRNLSNHDIAVATSSGRIQPLVFSAKSQTLISISAYLDSGRRSVRGWLSSICFTKENFDETMFVNINEISQLR